MADILIKTENNNKVVEIKNETPFVSKGDNTHPVYFDSTGQAQPITQQIGSAAGLNTSQVSSWSGARSIKFSDDTFLDASGIRHTKVLKGKELQSVANTFVYVDSVTIPANSDYLLDFEIVYDSAPPIGICVASDASDIASHHKRWVYDENACHANLCGYAASEITLHLWGKWSVSAKSAGTIRGIIHTYG